MTGNHDHEPTERVRPEDACPNCGERDMDLLVWDADGERVECQRCHTVYRPGERDAPSA